MVIRLLVSDIVDVTGGRLISGESSAVITSISTDTRTLKPGDFFIALRGENFDGAEFITDALAKGACGVMSADVPPETPVPEDKIYVQVENALRAMGDITALWRRRANPLIIAVIGSSGKTTTKDMIVHIAREKYNLVATKANFNNTIGVPLTLFDIEPDTEIAIVELGMNAPGELFRLSQIVDPDIVVVTNIGTAHIGMFSSHEALIRAKAEILDVIRPECILITNADCPNTPKFLTYARHRHKRITFGISNDADVRATDIRPLSPQGYEFGLSMEDRNNFVIRLPLYGRYNIHNALATIAALKGLDINLDSALKRFADFSPASMRSQTTNAGGITIISDCYNANPDSVARALASLGDVSGRGKRYVLLGDMLELGEDAEPLHRQVGALFGELDVALLVTFGDYARFIGESAASVGQETLHANTHNGAVDILTERINPGDTLLIKGSRLMKLETVTQKLLETLSAQALPIME